MGIVAHVDAGKTTLTEAMMYQTGAIRKFGRVDHGDVFLDPDALEKQRGITIFTHQASFTYQQLAVTLLDTPGHVDFASQTEQVLPVLDYAILVVAANDGIQGYTRTLWHLLQRYQVPTFIFINKGDLANVNLAAVIAQLQTELSPGCLPFDHQLTTADFDQIAMQDEAVLEDYLENGTFSDETIRQLIKGRKIFPCFTGSALKMSGIKPLLAGLEKWTIAPEYPIPFAARVFKISHDEKGNRLSWVKVTGGELPAKAVLINDEKADQLRQYNGANFEIQPRLAAGSVSAVTGLTSTYPGQGLGNTVDLPAPYLKPVLSYQVNVSATDRHNCLQALRELEDEDPLLKVSWEKELQAIHVHLMGEVQLQVLQQLLANRYHLSVSFDQGQVLYLETITASVEGVGHFEPLRHYAEVHLRLEPGELGSGITITSDCRTDVLDHNWQHQILTSLQAKEHRGVLIGAPLTDVKITLLGGRGHLKHTEGGDFRQATWRAVRQGLMELKAQGACRLLEPRYVYRLSLPSDHVGRAINDLQQMQADFHLNEAGQATVTITGHAPVNEMRDYAAKARAYTHGQGQLDLTVDGFQPCHNAAAIIDKNSYDPVADLANTPDSVFCAHGAGFPVSWDQVPQMAHFPYRKKR